MSEKEKDIEYRLVSLLIEKGWSVSFAESCTGGMIPARLINVPDASKVIAESVVTYSDDAKNRYLGVSYDTIRRCDVVSEEVAAEMAEGIARRANVQVAASTTGYAGPSGGSSITLPDGSTKDIPVGTVCFGFYICGKVTTFTHHYGDADRNEIRAAATEFVLATLYDMLL